MTKFLLIALLLNCLFGITSTNSQTKEKEVLRQEHLQAWKKQRKTGGILLGIGLGAITLGAIITVAELDSDAITIVGPTLAFLGIFPTLISIPVYISAGTHRRKAARLALAPESFKIPISANNTQKYAAVRLTIQL